MLLWLLLLYRCMMQKLINTSSDVTGREPGVQAGVSIPNCTSFELYALIAFRFIGFHCKVLTENGIQALAYDNDFLKEQIENRVKS